MPPYLLQNKGLKKSSCVNCIVNCNLISVFLPCRACAVEIGVLLIMLNVFDALKYDNNALHIIQIDVTDM